ncbi:MAG: hypothetical protein HZB47_03815 [Nitrosomonadales bacterium]|nr:hypothetical protein [Nitrosomonadales bacterium]
MIRKPHVRHSLAASLMLLGAIMIFLALETWMGTVVLFLGVLVEVVGIALKRRE